MQFGPAFRVRGSCDDRYSAAPQLARDTFVLLPEVLVPIWSVTSPTVANHRSAEQLDPKAGEDW